MRNARMMHPAHRVRRANVARSALKSAAATALAYGAARMAASWLRRYDFDKRLVAITGGSRGLGLLLARQLADEGASLVICARDDEELANAESELRGRAQFVAAFACDLTKPNDISGLFERIRREVGSVDVLVNNAGVIQVGPTETMTRADFEHAMAVHFWAPLLCCEQVLPEMRRRGSAMISLVSLSQRVVVALR